MNNEMLPFVVLLLQSEDLKKQSNRIIQEVKTSSDPAKIVEGIWAKAATGNFEGVTEASNRLVSTMETLQKSVDQLNNRISILENNGGVKWDQMANQMTAE